SPAPSSTGLPRLLKLSAERKLSQRADHHDEIESTAGDGLDGSDGQHPTVPPISNRKYSSSLRDQEALERRRSCQPTPAFWAGPHCASQDISRAQLQCTTRTSHSPARR